MTGIVGSNDYGKSTILKALAIFFETEGSKAAKSDMNCFSLAKASISSRLPVSSTTCSRHGYRPRHLVCYQAAGPSRPKHYIKAICRPSAELEH
ncbi:hypothetical protein D3C85_1609770 [compost metagenome]